MRHTPPPTALARCHAGLRPRPPALPVSAEHGIGLGKREQLHRSRSEAELQLMMRLKKMLDPDNILNPNKIFAAEKIAAI